MEKIFDLPAHPLFVHFPIVLTPLLALGAVVLIVRPRWQARGVRVLFGATVVTFIATLLARSSGEKMYDLLDQEPAIDRHRDLADQTTLLLFVFVVLTGAFFAVTQRLVSRATDDAASAGMRRAATALSALVVVFGVATAVWMARAGHEGAKSHWNFVNT